MATTAADRVFLDTSVLVAAEVGRLATLDQGDFRRYEDAIALEQVTT